ncbi:unnamed protein product [Durusdinium trenchii]|uniref:DUF659 domain-containing protein n=1 Tax=Durusdinium trenchii TaxID=1381693 RepID=A0ABP0SGP4_9DINO
MCRWTLASLTNPHNVDFLQSLDPHYKGITANSFREIYLPILYKEAQESLRNSLQGTPYVSLGADGGKKRYLYFTVSADGSEWFVGFWNSGSQAKDALNTVAAIEEKMAQVEQEYGVACASVCLDNEPKNRAVRESLHRKHNQHPSLLIFPACYLHGAQLFAKDVSQESAVVRAAIVYAEKISHFMLSHSRILSDWEVYSKEYMCIKACLFWYRALQSWFNRTASLQAVGKSVLEQYGQVKAIVASSSHRTVLNAAKAVLAPIYHFKCEVDRQDAALAHILPQLSRMNRDVGQALKSADYKAAHEHCVSGDVPQGMMDAHLRDARRNIIKKLQDSLRSHVQPIIWKVEGLELQGWNPERQDWLWEPADARLWAHCSFLADPQNILRAHEEGKQYPKAAWNPMDIDPRSRLCPPDSVWWRTHLEIARRLFLTQAIDKVYPEDCQDEDRRQIRKEVEEYVTRKGAWAGRSAWQDAAVYQTTTKLRSGREVVSFQRALPLHSFWRTHGASSAFQKLMLKLATVLASEGGVERASLVVPETRSGLSTYQQWAMEDVAKLGGDIFNEDWLDDEKVELETREEGDAEKGDSERQQLEAFAKERYPIEVLEKAHSRAASEATRHEAVDETVYVSDSDISDA